jgi:hypothetical protein
MVGVTDSPTLALWRHNRLDQLYTLTGEQFARQFAASRFHQMFLDGRPLDRALRGLLTANESDGGLASTLDETGYPAVLEAVLDHVRDLPPPVEVLRDLTYDNAWTDAEAGSVGEFGEWYGLIHVTTDEEVLADGGSGAYAGYVVPEGTYIVHQDADGACGFTRYPVHSADALAAWAEIQRRFPADGCWSP